MLTPKLRKLLVYIEREMAFSGGVPPSYREIAAAMGHRKVGAATHRKINCLQERGYIHLRHYKPRSIIVVQSVSRFAVFAFNPETKELEEWKTPSQQPNKTKTRRSRGTS